MIVWIASYPRSGNTYFRLLMNHLYGVHTLSQYDEGGKKAQGNPFIFDLEGERSLEAFLNIVGSEGGMAVVDQLQKDDQVHFVKTHGLPFDDSPFVYLIRDGRDALVSYAHFLPLFGDEHKDDCVEDVLIRLIDGNDGVGGWANHVTTWAKLGEKIPMAWMRYEDLIQQPATEMAAALNRLGVDLPLAGKEIPPFAELHNKWPAFFRTGKGGGWRKDMTEELQSRFWEKHGQIMQSYGYTDDMPANLVETPATVAA